MTFPSIANKSPEPNKTGFTGKSKVASTPASQAQAQEREEAFVARIMYREFFGPGQFRFAIYPDGGWKTSWGKPPLLGLVNADDEFLAEKLAYDRGFANPHNCTFGLKIKKIGPNSK